MKHIKWFLWLVLWVSTTVLALPSDSQQPLMISSDSMQYDHSKGVGHYVGHVNVDRGTSQLRCDDLTTYNDKSNKLTRFVARDHAVYRTITEKGKPELVAKANTIIYQDQTKQIQLKGKAHVTQGKNQFSGPVINYNVETKMVTTPKSSKGRTRIVIGDTKSVKEPQ